jgi:hypothetical protein
VESISVGEHKLTIYDNNQERDLLANLFLESAIKRGDYVAIFSGKSRELLHNVRKKRSFLSAFKEGRAVSLDANRVYKMESPVAGFSKLFDGWRSQCKKQGRELSLLGDCPPPAYQRYKVHYGIEEIVEARKTDVRSTILCIYRNEGLASLDPADFLFIYRTHDSIFLNHTELERSKKSG